MEIIDKIDRSKLREESRENGLPLLDLLMKKIKSYSCAHNEHFTIFAVCPNSFNVIKAALRAAKRAHSPIKFAATLNQVDIDRGYTGWIPEDLVRIIKEESCRIGYMGPVIVAIDHGGPWVKDIQSMEKWEHKRAMAWTKKSFEAAIIAGYDLIHVDPTVDIYDKDIKIETVVERTVELILHAEKFRKKNHTTPISYEVGTEEVKGGLADVSIFKKFIALLKDGLRKAGIDYIWPLFIVGKVGTDLHTSEFSAAVAGELVKIISGHNSYLKGHYTDFVVNPWEYPTAGVAAANVGPEFTMLEYDGFMELADIEDDLFRTDKIAKKSDFKKILEIAVVGSNRWQKWLRNDEKDLDSISTARKEFIVKTSCRYVWADPAVKAAQHELYRNLTGNGFDPENWILLKIEESMDKYFRAFNLINLNEKLGLI
jgi:D-tagatose-1,6-bisphosphate aldolase subunit GatZ/KbaZ